MNKNYRPPLPLPKNARKSKCEICGNDNMKHERPHVHHKDGDPFNNSPENLITLCRSCHNFQHKSRRPNMSVPFTRWLVENDYTTEEFCRIARRMGIDIQHGRAQKWRLGTLPWPRIRAKIEASFYGLKFK